MAIVRTDLPRKFGNMGGIVWSTKHYCDDGSTFETWQRDEYLGMSGLFNHNPDRALLGALHPNCIRCNEQGYCRTMCPTELPTGLTCTASMNHDQQEAQWPKPR